MVCFAGVTLNKSNTVNRKKLLIEELQIVMEKLVAYKSSDRILYCCSFSWPMGKYNFPIRHKYNYASVFALRDSPVG
jgi:hypothetical protein